MVCQVLRDTHFVSELCWLFGHLKGRQGKEGCSLQKSDPFSADDRPEECRGDPHICFGHFSHG